MSSGSTHDQFNSFCILSLVSGALATNSMPTLLVAGGFAIGTIWLSPDLDLEKSNPSNRLGILKPLFAPYRAICGHHRSLISHSPVLSTAIRVLYSLIPVFFYMVATKSIEKMADIVADPKVFDLYLGIELSTDVHLVLDWQYSIRKKMLRHR
jgi:uncharacterized metal-binding protein